MPYVTTNGIRTWYDVMGDGPPLMLIHCNPFDHRSWLYQTAWFSNWFKVVTPDLRGYGRTDKITEAYTLDDLASDLLGVIEAEQMRDIVLVGVSIGAILTLKLGHERPDLFRGLVAVGASAPAKDRGPNDPRVRGYREQGIEGYYRRHMAETVSASFAKSPMGQHFLDMFETNASNLEAEAIVKILQARAPVDLVPILPKIQRPLMIINGEHDSALREGMRAASLVPGATHHILPGTGHACYMEDPAGFNALLMEFLHEHALMPASQR